MEKEATLQNGLILCRLARSKLIKYLYYPYWLWFRLTNMKKYIYNAERNMRYQQNETEPIRKEDLLRTILRKNPGVEFLEIGIGFSPNFERLQLMHSLDIKYVGVDFEFVCARHIDKLKYAGYDTQNIHYRPNKVCTYAWTLFKLMQETRQFDVIYLDGHHTFYVDLPAAALANYCLRPGGYFVLDDILWTLEGLRKNMAMRFHSWSFYRNMYEFSQFTDSQQSTPHIKMIAEEYLMRRLKYRKSDEYSIPTWWVLQKPRWIAWSLEKSVLRNAAPLQ